MFTSSPVPKSLLDRLEALAPKPILRKLNHVERTARIQAILARPPGTCWRADRMRELLRECRARQDLA
jgi:hypothetical protein